MQVNSKPFKTQNYLFIYTSYFMPIIKNLAATVFIFLLISFTACGEPTDIQPGSLTEDVEKRIYQVENSLSEWVLIEGTSKWNILDRMKHYNVKGLSIAVIKDHQIEWAKGYGYTDSLQTNPIITSTVFQAASISKSLNSMALVKLAQEGKIDLDADINNYLKRWKFPYDSLSNGQVITTKNLLNHSGGLSISGFPGYATSDSIPSIIDILNGTGPANTAAVPSIFEPNKRVSYSGGGTTISQLMVEEVSGQKYEDYLHDQVLEPLGMSGSTFRYGNTINPELVPTGHDPAGNAVKGKYHNYPEKGAAGLWTTSSDLARFVIDTQLSLKNKSNKVLSKEMTELRFVPFDEKSMSGLGMFIDRFPGTDYFLHRGWNQGFIGWYIGDLKAGNGMAIMCNANDFAILNEVKNSIAAVYDWEDNQPVTKAVHFPSTEVTTAYLGEYVDEDDGTKFVVTKDADSLKLAINGGEESTIYFTSDTDFFILDLSFWCSFQKSETGEVKSILLKRATERFELIKS